MRTGASSGGARAKGVRVAYAHGVMFSPRDIVKLMGRIRRPHRDVRRLGGDRPDDQAHVLAGPPPLVRFGAGGMRRSRGKITDITIVDGDPLKLIFNLLNVAVVVRGGEIVDRR